MFQNGIKAIEEVLKVASHSPKHPLILLKAEAKELFSKMLSKLKKWYSWEGGDVKHRHTNVNNTELHFCEHTYKQHCYRQRKVGPHTITYPLTYIHTPTLSRHVMTHIQLHTDE